MKYSIRSSEEGLEHIISQRSIDEHYVVLRDTITTRDAMASWNIALGPGVRASSQPYSWHLAGSVGSRRSSATSAETEGGQA